jgi:hypothetical protein
MNFVFQSTFKKEKSFNLGLLIFSIAFAALFHGVAIGLNFAVLSVALILFWILEHPAIFKTRSVSFTALISLCNAVAIAWYGTWDVILWGFLCLLLLHQLVHFPESSILLFETKGFSNLLLAPFHGIYKSFQQTEEPTSFTHSRVFKFLLFGLLPLCFVLLFATIYKNLNPLFESLYVNFFEAIDFQLIALLLLGAFLSYALFKPQLSERIFLIDQLLPNGFQKGEKQQPHAATEWQVGITLFSLLNLMLLIFLVSDVVFLNQIRTGQAEDYARYVHQGVGLLILSIIIASSFILFFFRNAHSALLPKGHALKILALVWVLLNIGIVCTTLGKNIFYVDSFSLSLKRIGVFVYLTLAAAGLVMVFLKIQFQKTNAFLIRSVYWVFFGVLSANMLVDWSTLVTRYNIQQHVEKNTALDWEYLLSLNPRTLPTVLYASPAFTFSNPEQKAEFMTILDSKAEKLKDYNPDIREQCFALRQAQKSLVQ